MQISSDEWKEYADELAMISEKAAEELMRFIEKYGIEDRQRVIDEAIYLVNKYGEASAEKACEIYEKLAELQKAHVSAAEPAEIVPDAEIAKAVNGTMDSADQLKSAVGRLVKQASTDTTIKNCERDGARFAWIPSGGETCVYCLMLAATGWHKAGKNTLKGKYAGHIHANCKCTYAVDFDGTMKIGDYDPAKMSEEIEKFYRDGTDAESLLASTWNSKRGRADYSKLNEYRRFKELQREPLSKKKNPKAVMKRLLKKSEKWISALDEVEEKYIKKYTKNDGDESPNKLYQRLNRMLRGEIEYDEHLEEIAKHISSGIEKFELDEDIVCFRRSDVDMTEGRDVLEIFTSDQFVSTSIEENSTLKGNILMVIHVKKGSLGAYIEPLSSYKKQKEFLIDKKTVFRVLSRGEAFVEIEVC